MRLGSLFHVRPDPHALPPFIRAVEDVDGVRIVRLRGDVGKAIGAEYEAREAALAHDETRFDRHLLVDYADAHGCDFASLSFLVQQLGRRVHRGVGVAILHAPPELRAELEIARLGDLFGLYDDEADALAALRAARPSPPGPTA